MQCRVIEKLTIRVISGCLFKMELFLLMGENSTSRMNEFSIRTLYKLHVENDIEIHILCVLKDVENVKNSEKIFLVFSIEQYAFFVAFSVLLHSLSFSLFSTVMLTKSKTGKKPKNLLSKPK